MREKFDQILLKIEEIERDFQANQGIILTEDDLKCLAFHKFYNLFQHNLPLFNSTLKGSPLHSEIKFFNQNGKLFFRPDITIIKPENYSILHSISDFVIKDDRIIYKATSSKEFEFGGDAIIIEFKFFRGKNGITKINSLKKDIEKIRELKRLVERDGQSKVLGLLAVFNKTDRKSSQLQTFIASLELNDEIGIKYYSGKVQM